MVFHPMFHERFARQCRYEPPPEFPPDFALLKLRSPSFKSSLFFLLKLLSRSRNSHRHRPTFIHTCTCTCTCTCTYTYTYHSHDHAGLQVTYHDGSAFSGLSSRKEKTKEKNTVKNARTHRKRIGTNSGTMYHTTKHSSVKHTLRCLHIMHLVCYVGESVCAISHLQYFLPCHVAAGHATPAARHQEETRYACACQALERDVWKAKKKT